MTIRRLRYVAVLLLVACSGTGIGGAPPLSSLPRLSAIASTVSRSTTSIYAGNDIPPRFQWEENGGYCGEVSMISAGLYYGQYVSQYEARAIASNGTPQYRLDSQLLLGVNASHAAKVMHLSSLVWSAGSGDGTGAFLQWVKRNVVAGRPVIIGVYNNEYRLYGNSDPNAGDSQYDHIVPVSRITSAHPLADPSYDPKDTLTFSDNGLWGTVKNPPYLFTYAFGAFQKTRAQANAKNGPVYSLSNKVANDYGIAITGVADADRETIPVRLSTNVNDERPEIANGSNARPTPMPLVLTITLSDLQPGVAYRLYRYDSFAAVPDAAFNANAGKASARWTIQVDAGSSFTFSQRILSDQVVVYRAVAATAP